jgi:putative transposase
MPNYRRLYVPGGTFFFTLVTQDRRPILTSEMARSLLRKSILDEQAKRPFGLVAMVLLPDHLHAVWTLPPGDDDYSRRWQQIKGTFTESYLMAGGAEGTRSTSREKHDERGVWQRRFWEHTVTGDDDMKRCIDYIHWNPVKHGYVTRPIDYQWSTFRQFVRMGEYELEWGTGKVKIADIAGAEWE